MNGQFQGKREGKGDGKEKEKVKGKAKVKVNVEFGEKNLGGMNVKETSCGLYP